MGYQEISVEGVVPPFPLGLLLWLLLELSLVEHVEGVNVVSLDQHLLVPHWRHLDQLAGWRRW